MHHTRAGTHSHMPHAHTRMHKHTQAQRFPEEETISSGRQQVQGQVQRPRGQEGIVPSCLPWYLGAEPFPKWAQRSRERSCCLGTIGDGDDSAPGAWRRRSRRRGGGKGRCCGDRAERIPGMTRAADGRGPGPSGQPCSALPWAFLGTLPGAGLAHISPRPAVTVGSAGTICPAEKCCC